ncbi:MAG: LPS assembly lipoprotein LptE [Holophagales bacterium]|jgi:hypothetical protein|nr:LPS assembly lipoprotein LptE [Holophagales bacterium]
MRQTFFLIFFCYLAGCGYHRLDRTRNTVSWIVRGETVSLGRIYNNTKQGRLEDVFKKAIENRVISSSPWKLAARGAESRWILQGTILSYEIRPLGLNLRSGQLQGAAGSASRVEIVIVASLQLLDGQSGALVVDRPQLTFRNQYRMDQNFASFESRELQIIESLADDFAESFLMQLLEGHG